MLKITQTTLPGVVIATPKRFGDHRGFFGETWNSTRWQEHGIGLDFVQDNQALSSEVGTLRGLHFQAPPHAQDKLVRCGRGRILDVAVDIRKGSPNYGHWVGVELSFENGRQLLVPAGFLHGYVTREPDTEVVYKCTDQYAPECEGAVRWDDPGIGIDWGLEGPAILSEKDMIPPYLNEFDSPFTYSGPFPWEITA